MGSMVAESAARIVLEGMIYVVWADGRLGADEVSALRAATSALRLETDEDLRKEIREGRDKPPPSDALSEEERWIAFASAAWIALTGDSGNPVGERVALSQLRTALELSDFVASKLEARAGFFRNEWSRTVGGELVDEYAALIERVIADHESGDLERSTSMAPPSSSTSTSSASLSLGPLVASARPPKESPIKE